MSSAVTLTVAVLVGAIELVAGPVEAEHKHLALARRLRYEHSAQSRRYTNGRLLSVGVGNG